MSGLEVPGWVMEPVSFPYDGHDVHHLGGLSWLDAPIPPVWHLCRVQTREWVAYFSRTDRCACGATRAEGGEWTGRNSRRRGG